MKFQWKGVFPALTTKFTDKDELDLAMFGKNLDAQLSAGVDGIVLGGTLGEASVLTTDEKEILVKFAVEQCNGKVPVILNIAEGSTKEALKQIELAKKWGANGLMMLPPMRYRSDFRETVTYFKTLANSTDLSIMLYNNPFDYRIEITMEMFEELRECENIEAVKESTRDITNVTRMISRFGSRYKIMCGVDTLAMEELVMGADGWIAGLVCAFPKETVAIYRLIKTGELEEARKIYRWFMPLLELDIHPKLVQYIKLAESRVGLGTETVRPPRLVLQGDERLRILKIIDDAVEVRPVLPQYFTLKETENV
jgi:1-pyrroline-4-hydroxy-2-carboxylate deaminase